MRRGSLLAWLVALGAALTLGAAAPPRAADTPLLALVRSGDGKALARMDATTLRPLDGPTVALRAGYWPWAYSPDRQKVAVGEARTVAIVDVARIQVVRRIGGLGGAGQLMWLTPHRLVALYSFGATVVDPQAGRVVRKTVFGGEVVTTARAGARLLVLVTPYGVIGRVRLFVVDASGRARSVTLRRIHAGIDTQKPAARTPGVAADAATGRAFVVSGGEPLAEIRLSNLAVRYHSLGRPLDKAEPTGPTRYARWVGNGLLAVAGEDAKGQMVDGQFLSETKPSGLQLIDTRTWHVQTLEAGATRTALAGARILAYGATFRDFRPTGGIGLGLYGRDGSAVAHLFGTQPVQRIQVAGTRAFVDGESSTSVVDLQAGTVVGTLPGFAPDLLVGDSREWER